MKIEHIKKNYKNKQVLKNITFSVEEGSCVGILGGNGSGKSTLLSILAGVLHAQEGSFLWEGTDLFTRETLRTTLVGYVPQGNPLIGELTGWDNLLLWYDKDTLKKELQEGVLAILGISEFMKLPVGKMSGGMQKRLSIGCAVAHKPRILLLDEPSAALDFICKERIYNYLQEFKQQGGRVILATHDLQELDLCDKLFILKDGTLIPYQYDGNIHHLVGKL